MLRGDELTRDLLAEAIRGAVDDTVKRQLQRRAQEPAISSKIAAALEERLDGLELNGYTVNIVAQDFPDRGRASWEHEGGADLFIGIRVQPPVSIPPIAKGLLIQSKKAQPIGAAHVRQSAPRVSGGKAQRDLYEQCEKIEKRSPKGSFVWVYSAGGAHIVPASEVLQWGSVPPEFLAGRTVGEHFREVLDCFAGDPDLVGEGIFTDDKALGNFLEEIAVRRGVTISLEPDRF